MTMTSANKDMFSSFFPIVCLLYLFLALLHWLQSMLNKSSESKHLCLLFDFSEESIQFLTSKYNISFRFFIDGLYKVVEVLFYS